MKHARWGMSSVPRGLRVGGSMAALTVGLVGCSPLEPPPEPVARAVEPIKGGYDDMGDTNTVNVQLPAEGYLCSGSLIAPNLVLTAHHCVANILNGSSGVICSSTKFSAPYPASHFTVSSDYNAYNGGSAHGVIEVKVPTTDPHLCGKDLALLILNTPFSDAEAVPLVPRVDTEIERLEIYTAIGYGGYLQDGTGAGVRRRRDKLKVDCGGTKCSKYVADPTEWVGQEGICEGDSGGPAIDAQGRVAGVTSRGMAGCVSPVYGSVAGWGKWIKDTAVYAASLGGYEPAPWATGYPTDPVFSAPVGATCTQPADCAGTSLCYDGYCTRPCTDVAVCPTGYDCVPNGNYSLCAQTAPPPDGSGAGGGGGAGSNGDEPQKSGCSVRSGSSEDGLFAFATAIALVAFARRRARAVG